MSRFSEWTADHWDGITMYLSYLFGIKEEIDASYVDQLRRVISELRVSNIIPMDPEKEDVDSFF